LSVVALPYPAPAGLRRRDVPPALAALGVTGLDPDMTVVRARATGAGRRRA
jgi:hypothetical protein